MTLRDVLDDALIAARLLGGVRGYFRRPLTTAECLDTLAKRRANRDGDFLSLVRRAVYANPTSPYLQLLRHAGCEYGDLARLVASDGLENALGRLRRDGVFLTSDEFRGRQRVVRGSLELEAHPAALRNPIAAPAMSVSTSGSAGRALAIPIGLGSTHDRAVNVHLGLEARHGSRCRHAVWGAPGLSPALWYSARGTPIDRWFSHLDLTRPGVGRRHRYTARGVRISARSAGVRLPVPEYVSLESPMAIVSWMASVLREHGIPHLFATVSGAVRVCRAASERGIDLRGALMSVGGEPITARRMAVLSAVGVHALPDYGSAESGGPLAYGCLMPSEPDDVHFFDDLHALVSSQDNLFITSLRDTAPFVMLNASLGDSATVEQRRCGCPLERAGWRTHLHTIRSHEKLMIAGTTFLDTDVIAVLDETLPETFGGGPTDYQLTEEDTGIVLVVAPGVGPLEPSQVLGTFLDALTAKSSSLRAMSEQWRGLLAVERRDPVATPTGKIMHLARS